MRGLILAGGNGSRIGRTAEIYNKHVSQCYDRPVIHYPLRTLAEQGCESAVIVGSPKSIGDISAYVKDGAEFGLDVAYKVQAEPNGVAGAIKRAQNLMSGVFPLILGDCYYASPPKPRHSDTPTMFWHEFEFADQHSVWSPEADIIVEKPRYIGLGNRAIVAYFYDERMFEFIDGMTPAQSGELEIVDIHNFYRQEGIDIIEYQQFFADMGTPDGLLRAAQYEQGRRNSCENKFLS